MISRKNEVIAIILARSGSKGLIDKNILPLNGKPLISYSIEAAKLSKLVDRVVVSTDCEKIQKIAINYGAEAPFIRPQEFSDDNATSEIALKHAVEWLIEHEKKKPNIIVYLQITDVFRSKNMIDDCVNALLINPDIDSAFMGTEVHKNFWRKKQGNFTRIANDIPYGLPRQKREPLYREDTGLALASRTKVILEGKRIGNNVTIIPYNQNVDFIDIHSDFDLRLSELLIRNEKIIPNE